MPDWLRGCYSDGVPVNVYQAVKDAMQDLIAPQLASLQGEIAAVRGEMTGFRGEMGSLRAEMGSLRGELLAHITRLDERITIALDLRERIAAIEATLRS